MCLVTVCFTFKWYEWFWSENTSRNRGSLTLFPYWLECKEQTTLDLALDLALDRRNEHDIISIWDTFFFTSSCPIVGMLVVVQKLICMTLLNQTLKKHCWLVEAVMFARITHNIVILIVKGPFGNQGAYPIFNVFLAHIGEYVYYSNNNKNLISKIFFVIFLKRSSKYISLKELSLTNRWILFLENFSRFNAELPITVKNNRWRFLFFFYSQVTNQI